jgi:hypothetical protein
VPIRNACSHFDVPSHGGDDGFGLTTSSVDRDHNGKSCAPQPTNWFGLRVACFRTGAYTRSLSSNMTAATPPMKTDCGFLNTRREIEPGGTSAVSPMGRKKPLEGWSRRSKVLASQPPNPLHSGQGRRWARSPCETPYLPRSNMVLSSSSSDRGEMPSERNPGRFSEAVVSICISST